MKPAFDLTSVRLTLRQGIEKGYWTIEQLDQPSPYWSENSKRFRLHHPNYRQQEYQNLLRNDDQLPKAQEMHQPTPSQEPSDDFPF